MVLKRYLAGRYRSIVWAALIAVAAAMWPPSASAAEFEVVVNPGVGVSSLTKAEIKAIFLGDRTTWPDGKPVKIVLLEEGAVHKAFLRDIVGKTPIQFSNYWTKLIFTGRAGTPRTFPEMQQVAEFVAKQAGAIGYVAAGRADRSLKVLSVQ